MYTPNAIYAYWAWFELVGDRFTRLESHQFNSELAGTFRSEEAALYTMDQYMKNVGSYPFQLTCVKLYRTQ